MLRLRRDFSLVEFDVLGQWHALTLWGGGAEAPCPEPSLALPYISLLFGCS